MRFVRLALDWDASPQEFVEQWRALYDYGHEHLYADAIGKPQFSVSDVEGLFLWKNGQPLSAKKAKTVRSITDRIQVVNQLKSSLDMDTFQEQFDAISAIWKIFLLHIIAPRTFPIFDQHVYRAYCFLQTGSIQEIPPANPTKEKVYFQQYVPFFNALQPVCETSRKQVDEALWAFGRFLKTASGLLRVAPRSLSVAR